MPQNIKAPTPVFCIGPQIGTYCCLNYSINPITMQVKNSSGTLLRTYTFSPNDTLVPAPYRYSTYDSYVAGQVMAAKTFVFDFENNQGDGTTLGVRSIEFYDSEDVLIELSTDDFLAYSTTETSRPPSNAFDTSLSKTGHASAGWEAASGSISNQRLVCNFNTVKNVKKIVVNNYHHYGGYLTRGVKNTKIYFLETDYIDTVYSQITQSFHKIIDSSIDSHIAGDVVHDQELSLESESFSTSIGEPVALKYAGPKNQTSFYDGAIFYTLERVSSGYRSYYTYKRDPITGDYLRTANGSLVTSRDIEYRSNIIRKWRINNDLFTLDLVSSVYKVSDFDDWFAASTFSIQTHAAALLDHVPKGTGEISFTTVSGLSKYDTVVIGPSSDTDNLAAAEEVYIHNIIDNKVYIKTYGGTTPTKYEYVEGDPVTVIRYAHLPSSSKPLIDASNIRYAFDPSGGTLFTLDLNSFCEVVDRHYSAMFSDVQAVVWNSNYDTVSFIKGHNLLHYSLLQNKPIKTQYLKNMYDDGDTPAPIPVYDIDFNISDIYRLQASEVLWDDAGRQSLVTYGTYNYIVDALEVYSNNMTVYSSKTILGYQGASTITAVVRDQFGVGLSSKDVSFTVEPFEAGVFEPLDGNVVTDINGKCSIQFTAQSSYTGSARLVVKTIGANTGFGSQYLVGTTNLCITPVHYGSVLINSAPSENNSFVQLMSTPFQKASTFSILCFVRRSTPGGEWRWSGSWPIDLSNPTIDNRNISPSQDNNRIAFLSVLYEPVFSQIMSQADGSLSDLMKKKLPKVFVTQTDIEGDTLLPSTYEAADSRYLSQNYLSRHFSTGNIVSATVSQFSFTQEAIPAFWSERNTSTVNYWIRLRPYSYSLDITTLSVRVYERSWAGESAVVDIAPLSTLTTFDAGSGLEGVELSYVFPTAFHNNGIVFVDVQIYDQAPVPNIIAISYWFKIIPDYTKPYIINRYPAVEAHSVTINTEITFDILDKGDGVDISTLNVYINNRQVLYNYVEFLPGQFNITCSNDLLFSYGQEVTVEVFVKDLSDNTNLLNESWNFYCIDSSGPWFNEDGVSPGRCTRGLDFTEENISAQVYAINATGIAYDSLRMDVGGKNRNIKITPIVYRLK